jgi:hypothetical protein
VIEEMKLEEKYKPKVEGILVLALFTTKEKVLVFYFEPKFLQTDI